MEKPVGVANYSLIVGKPGDRKNLEAVGGDEMRFFESGIHVKRLHKWGGGGHNPTAKMAMEVAWILYCRSVPNVDKTEEEQIEALRGAPLNDTPVSSQIKTCLVHN